MKRFAHLLLPCLALSTMLTATPVVAASSATDVSPSAAVSASEPESNLIDLNSASLKELRSLPGIGNVYSRKIVEGRPYQRVDDLRTRNILPKGTYASIRDQVVAKPENRTQMGGPAAETARALDLAEKK